ncbi:MAG: tetraacyldisaccharide 4'-kinase [Candidatus Latescibacterota bacterium]|nr:MAG: tetraacyldisaccharide 4'-kinase [Candidatus Latescibacterota bacterium]
MDKHEFEILYPLGKTRLFHTFPRRGLISDLMLPGAVLYKIFASRVRRTRLKHRRAGGHDTVISIGNIEVGGNGKTPFAIYLIRRLVDLGHRPIYVSRGFKSSAEKLGVVTVLIPESFESQSWAVPGVRVLRVGSGPLTRAIGDEGAVVMTQCSRIPLLFCRDRQRAIDVAREMFDPTHIVIDDAFQTWAVARDVDVVLLDAADPLGNGRLVPAGSLREGPEVLARAHVVGFNDLGSGVDLRAMSNWVSSLTGRQIPVFGIRRSLSILDTDSRTPVKMNEGPSASMSSVGRPERFERALLGLGIDLRVSIRLPDHHRYDRSDIDRIERMLSDRGVHQLVVTEKDWVKLRELDRLPGRLWVARLELDIVGEDPVLLCEKPQALPAAFSTRRST